MDAATAYARSVVSGETIAGPHVRNACKRHLDDLENGAARGLVWDREAAERITGYCRDVCRLNGGKFEGLPFNPLPWQEFILQSLFGWKLADGSRRFSRAYIEAGKGAGKSPLAGAIGLYMLTACSEARAEVYAAATKKDQAMILFRDAVAMVDQSPALASRLVKSGKRPVWQLSHADSQSFFRPISADDGQSGPRPYCALIDEIHEHKTRDVIDMLEAGFKFRRDPLLFMITNSGFDRESVCYEEHLRGRRAAAQEVQDDKSFSYICALDEGDDPLKDESCWIKANPSLGVTITEKWLRDRVETAKLQLGKRNGILRLHFCVWTDAEAAWIGRDEWMAVEAEIDDEEFVGRICYGGLDLSSKNDLTALSLVWPESDNSGAAAKTWFWTPGDSLKARSERDKAPYDLWAEQEYIYAPPGSVIDYGFVAHKIAELAERYEVRLIAFDPHKIEYLRPELDDIGCNVELIPHSQGFWKPKATNLWIPESISRLERLIFDKTIKIDANPAMRWCAANAVIREDENENRKFDKRKSTGRIDGVVSLAMAVGVAFSGEEKTTTSVWEKLAMMSAEERAAYL